MAILGVLVIAALGLSAWLVVESGVGGAAAQPYQACCCNILAGDPLEGRTLVRSQVQTFADNCMAACGRYAGQGKVFPQEGLCVVNP